MQSAGFGWPATAERPDQPRGHYGTPPDVTIQETGLDPFGLQTYFGAAGAVNCSIDDLARFAAFQLKALNDLDSALDAETVNHYWTAAESEERKYGYYGSSGTFLAMIMLYPDSNFGLVAATNHGLYAMPSLKKIRDVIHQQLINEESQKSPSD